MKKRELAGSYEVRAGEELHYVRALEGDEPVKHIFWDGECWCIADAVGAVFLGYATLHHYARNADKVDAGLQAVAEHALLRLELRGLGLRRRGRLRGRLAQDCLEPKQQQQDGEAGHEEALGLSALELLALDGESILEFLAALFHDRR